MTRTKPGPGWKRLGPAVWEHVSGTRIQVGGMVRLPSGRHVFESRWPENKGADRAIAICGGNRKRGMMVWALNLLENKQ